MKKIIRAIYLVLAFLFLGIGIAGIVLPILPTTPFLLLTAALFAKSSERFHKWFVSTKLYDKYIDQALNRKAMTKETKRKAMATLGIIFLAGFFFFFAGMVCKSKHRGDRSRTFVLFLG